MLKTKTLYLPTNATGTISTKVIATQYLKPWMVILYVKLIEVIMQTRPSALIRLFFHKEARLRSAMRWYTRIGRRVWMWELYQFFFVPKLAKEKMKMRDFWA
ncbi:MAG: hypothetical protein M0D57_05685 [Sphingobacteriales bacterium JAD_PAG50586_3]|nr:MAG: hypothetical protein M0D57_05685 [Sphingobacteriales bacterium JAD_PAG50586_3]